MRLIATVGCFLAVTAFAMAEESYDTALAALQAQLASNPSNVTLLVKLGDLCHDEGVKDNPEAVKLGEKYLNTAISLDPSNALARVLHGSIMTMRGRDSFWPTTQIELVHQGNREMDAAVKMAPEDPMVRFARANNNFYMPKFLGRQEIVLADFTWLWEQVQKKHPRLDVPHKQEIGLLYGLTLKKRDRTDEALEVWRDALAIEPDSAFAQKINAELQKVEKKRKRSS
jgi:tetratricopeptide (TPR) repeat protein